MEFWNHFWPSIYPGIIVGALAGLIVWSWRAALTGAIGGLMGTAASIFVIQALDLSEGPLTFILLAILAAGGGLALSYPFFSGVRRGVEPPV